MSTHTRREFLAYSLTAAAGWLYAALPVVRLTTVCFALQAVLALLASFAGFAFYRLLAGAPP